MWVLHLPASLRLKDVKWHSQTCVLGWPVQGREISTVDCTLMTEENGSNNVVASGDCFGLIQLLRHPSTTSFAQSKIYRKHCGEVVKARWAGNGSHLITLGSYDQAIMIWKHNVDDEGIADGENAAATQKSKDDSLDVQSLNAEVLRPPNPPNDNGLARPWVASMVEPSKAYEVNPHAPDQQLQLVYVHGFHSQYASNLVYNIHGNMIFPSAQICIVYDKDHHTQKYYREHKGQVGALCIRGRFVASGEIGPRPRIHIWDSCTCSRITVLPEYHRRGIACLAFSNDNKELISAGADQGNSIAVWLSLSGEWHDAVMRLHALSGGSGLVHFTSFASRNSLEAYYVTGGEDHINFWSKDGAVMRGIFGKAATSTSLLCGVTVGDFFVTGTITGYLYAWEGRAASRTIKAHNGSVNCLHSFEGGVVAGGADGRMTVWSDKLVQMKLFDLEASGIQSVHVLLTKSRDSIGKILVGTRDNSIYEVAYQSGVSMRITENHKDEALGLAVHPSQADLFVTCGGDGVLRVYSIKFNSVVRKANLGHNSLGAVAWSNDGKQLLVGCGGRSRSIRDGVHFIVDAESMKILHEGRDSSFSINDAKYSPSSAMFALACADHRIYIHENSKPRFKLRTICEKSNAIITSIDFSSDSFLIRSDSTDNEHLCFNSDDGEAFSITSQLRLRNVEWSTSTCCYGWEVQGLWPPVDEANEKTRPVSVDCSPCGKLLASGTRDGAIKLYNFPVISKEANCNIETGHVYDVRKVRFSCDSQHLVTQGQFDRTIMVFRVRRAAD